MRSKSIWINKVNCRDCHGWGGHGDPDDPQAPRGPNLRETNLDAEGLADVTRCGRPGTPMPYFRRTAWNPGEANCYGITREELGDDVPQRGIVTLTEREIRAITTLIIETFVGKGQPTFEECIEFWGVGATTCPRYPRPAPNKAHVGCCGGAQPSAAEKRTSGPGFFPRPTSVSGISGRYSTARRCRASRLSSLPPVRDTE